MQSVGGAAATTPESAVPRHGAGLPDKAIKPLVQNAKKGYEFTTSGDVTQLGECHLRKVEVVSSNLIVSTRMNRGFKHRA